MKRLTKWLILPFLIACVPEGYFIKNDSVESTNHSATTQSEQTTASSTTAVATSKSETAVPIDHAQYNSLAALTSDPAQKPV
ncbi:hypothetical protein [Enterococcus gilvus]|uniref:hypothetical protein n=1 Tax=Enterococcus gilvus TaxID=160453 RepID=UPI003EDB2571